MPKPNAGMKIDNILGDLARHSHQAKGTDSYYPLVAKAKSALWREIEKVIPKKKRIMEYSYNSVGYNVALSDLTAWLKEMFK